MLINVSNSGVVNDFEKKGLNQRPCVDFRFAAAVAAFVMFLRDSDYRAMATYLNTLQSAEGSLRDKTDADREKFARLVRVAPTIEQAKEKK